MVYIICSDRARVGKTLLARVFAGMLGLRRDGNPLVFDTDLSGNGIINYLAPKTTLIDLSKVSDQVALFDTMIEARDNRLQSGAFGGTSDFVVDLAASDLRRFFDLFNDIGFERGAKEAELDVRVYYLVSWTLKSLQTCQKIASTLTSSQFTAVRNMAINAFAFIPEAGKEAQVPDVDISLFISALSPAAFGVVNQHGFSFSRFISGGHKEIKLDVRQEIWRFLENIYNQTNAGVI